MTEKPKPMPDLKTDTEIHELVAMRFRFEAVHREEQRMLELMIDTPAKQTKG